jgi:hypothetical protein
MLNVENLYRTWKDQPDIRSRDRLVAEAIAGGSLPPEAPIPHYASDRHLAGKAMDDAWRHREEEAPVRVCGRAVPSNDRAGHTDCHVEWWSEEQGHTVTPRFPTESEARAFAAFAFARLENTT